MLNRFSHVLRIRAHTDSYLFHLSAMNIIARRDYKLLPLSRCAWSAIFIEGLEHRASPYHSY